MVEKKQNRKLDNDDEQRTNEAKKITTNQIKLRCKMSWKYNLKMANDCFSRHCLLNIVWNYLHSLYTSITSHILIYCMYMNTYILLKY